MMPKLAVLPWGKKMIGYQSRKNTILSLIPIIIIQNSHAYSTDLTKVNNKIKGELVQVEAQIDSNTSSLGSGFWIDRRGYVATCWHVVAKNPNADIYIKSATDSLFDTKNRNFIYSNWEVYRAKIYARDEKNDLAILKVDTSPFLNAGSVPIQIGNTALTAHYDTAQIRDSLPNPGEDVLVAGYPLGLPYRIVQPGNVASIANNLPGWGDTLKILISAVANHGNSGGPVFDDEGKVIGLLEGEFSTTANERTGLEIVVPAYLLNSLSEGAIK